MTIEEAKQILQTELSYGVGSHDPDLEHAIQLAIEALTAWKRGREEAGYPRGYQLPGETEE